MTLFSPVIEAPQPADLAPASVSRTSANQVQSMPLAEETRLSISAMLKQMPNSPETRVLREEFQAIQARLVGIQDDAKAEAIIDDGLNTLSKRVAAEPNSDQIVEVMMKMLEGEDNQQAAKVLQLSSLQSQGNTPALVNVQAQAKSWGWLS